MFLSWKKISVFSLAVACWLLGSPGLSAGESSDSPSLKNCPVNPVFSPGQGELESPCVVYDAGFFGGDRVRYRAWYGLVAEDGTTRIGEAHSDDGRQWQEREAGLLSGLAEGSCSHPAVVYDPDRFGSPDGPLYRIWYRTGDGPADSVSALRCAESEDGLTWHNDRPLLENPHFPLTSGGDGDPSGKSPVSRRRWFRYIVGPGQVLYNPEGSHIARASLAGPDAAEPLDCRYVMYYPSASGKESPDGSLGQVSLAYSADGISWTRWGETPVVIPGGTGAWDAGCILSPSVAKLDGTYHLWYSGGAAKKGEIDARGIGHGTSYDGINWVLDDEPVLHVEDGPGWRESLTADPWIVPGMSVYSPHSADSRTGYTIWAVGESLDGTSSLGYWEAGEEYEIQVAGIRTLLPEGPGDSTQWTPVGEASNWECVREQDGDAGYVYSLTEWMTDRYEMEDLEGSLQVEKVVLTVTARKAVRPSLKIYAGISSDGVDDLARISLGNGYAEYVTEWTEDPGTGQPWTVAGINQLKTVIQRQSNHGREGRVTQVRLEIHYTTVATPTPPPTATPSPTSPPAPTAPPSPTAVPTASSPPTTTPYLVAFTDDYLNDFDLEIDGWLPTDEQTPDGFIDALPGDWGGVFQEYRTPDLGDGDRTLSIYKSSSSSTARWRIDFINETGEEITELSVAYDFEVPWTRFDSGNRAAQMHWYLDPDGPSGPAGFGTVGEASPVVTDAESTAITWLTDDQMDDAGLAARNLSFRLTGLSIAPGTVFSLAVGRTGTGAPGNQKNMNFGIDNLRIHSLATTPTPTPAPNPSASPVPATPTPVPTPRDLEILLNANKPAILAAGGYVEFTITGSWSYVEVDGVRTELSSGDLLRLTLGDDGQGGINIASGGRVSTFSFDDVAVSLNGSPQVEGTITGIYVSGSTGLVSTLELEVPRQSAWTQFRVDGETLINGTDEQRIFLDGLKPGGLGTLSLSNSGSNVWCTGGAEDYQILPPTTPTPTATPSATPSLTPTTTPSATPSTSPTPSTTPTATPSATPSLTPTTTPSATPSMSPTPSTTPPPTPPPTAAPTTTLPPTPPPTTTPAPTTTPSVVPTSTPSASPTVVPPSATPAGSTPVPSPTAVNIALGKSATSSSCWGYPFEPFRVTDGSVEEDDPDYCLLANDAIGWIRVDLGAPYFLSEVRWLNTHNGASGDRAVTDWRLLVSKDGVEYFEMASGTEEFSEDPSWVVIDDLPEDISYRYLRVQVDGYYDRGGGINEIEAFGILDNPGVPNVALGKPVTASGFHNSSVGPEHVVDGSYFEEDLDYWLLPDSTSGWVMVDLGKIYDISKIRWLNTHNGAYCDRAARDWRIELSQDGVTFTEYTSGTQEFSSTPAWVEFKHIAVTARYFRLQVDDYYDRGGGINEIEVYGYQRNIALGQTATASSTHNPTVAAEHVVDGSILEENCTDYWLLPNDTTGWVQVELDSLYQLSGIRWLNTHNDGYDDRAAAAWRMAISADGVEFIEVANGYAEFTSTPEWVDIDSLPSGSDSARYVRLYVDGYHNRGGGANELEVFARLKMGRTNLALGRPCQASGEHNATVGAGNVVDGSFLELSSDYWLLPNSTPGWVEVDLEEERDLTEIRWLNTHNGPYHDRAATDWRLSVSSDGVDYVEVASGTQEFTTTPAWVVVPLEETAARYVRLHVDGYHNRGGGINELEVY